MRLTDLRVAQTIGPVTEEMLVASSRPVTVADLVAALIEQGGEIKGFDREGIPNHWIEEGSYLVFRLPDEETPCEHGVYPSQMEHWCGQGSAEDRTAISPEALEAAAAVIDADVYEIAGGKTSDEIAQAAIAAFLRVQYGIDP